MPKVYDLATARNKNSLKRRKKWVIAVDPFNGSALPSWLTSALSNADDAGADVYLAYVLGPAGFNWTGDFTRPWVERFKPLAEERLRKVSPKHVKTIVIACRESGVRALTRGLLRFSTRIHADAVVVSTHAHAASMHWVMGSFAETLVLSSSLPVLVLNPAHPVPQRVRRILVPTDLGKESVATVLAIGAYARVFGAEVVLYHKPHDPAAPLLQQGVYHGGWVSFASFLDREMEDKAKQLQALEAKLRRRGVVVSSVLDTSEESLVASIESAAEIHSADLVAVTTHAAPWTEALLGSVARGLVRTAAVPVMVWR